MDIECVMKYMALQTIVVNYDCMTGHNVQNYYLREADGQISLIPWDYNLAWGGYPDGEDEEDGLEDFDTLSLPQREDLLMEESTWSKEDVSRIINFPINTPFSGKLSERTFFMNLLSNETYRARYYHYLNRLCSEYIKGGEFHKTVATIKQEIGSFVGTESNAFYSNKRFYKAVETFDTVLQRRAASVIGQLNGSIPSTWEGQEKAPQKLVSSDDINLSDMGGLMVMEKKQ